MKSLIAVLLSLLSGGPVAAQISDEYRTCSQEASTQTALRRCADAELRRADRELHDAYARLFSRAKDQTGAAVKIKALERAWMVYRDALVEALYPATDKQAEYGTQFVVEALLIRAKMTRAQAVRLAEVTGERAGSVR